jgi:hypothetical protein
MLKKWLTNCESALRLASRVLLVGGSGAVSTDISPSPLIAVLLNPVLIVSIPSRSTSRDSTAACSASTLWAYVEVEASLQNFQSAAMSSDRFELVYARRG